MQLIEGKLTNQKDKLYLAYRLRDIKIAARIPDLEMVKFIVEEIHEIFDLVAVEDKGEEEYKRRQEDYKKNRGF